MGYSKWELREAKLLLRKVGFSDDDKIEKILNHYLDEHGTETSYTVVSYGNRRNNYKPTIISHKLDTSYKCLNLLRQEVEFRQKHGEIVLLDNKKSEYISATDLSSFIFCPASYSISKTFKIEHLSNKSKIDKGNQHHDELRLIKNKNFGFDEYYISKLSNKKKSILNKLKNCKLIHSGHNENSKSFINHEKKYTGNPDYIFLDPKNNYLVIEEKYHYLTPYIAENSSLLEMFIIDNKKNFSNNIIQLQSYIDYIKEYDIKYGVLINWYYTFKKGELFFSDFTYKVINKGDNNIFLEKTFSEINNFKKNKIIDFKNNVNLNKCLNCSVSLYCSHKTDNFDKLQLPYNLDDLKLINIENNIDDDESEEEIPIF